MAGTMSSLKFLTGLTGSTPKIIRAVNSLSAKIKPSAAPLTSQIQLRNYSIQAPVSKPEGRTLCTLIPGDGVGPEMMQSMQEILEAAGAPVDFETYFLSELHNPDVDEDDIQPMLSTKVDDVVNSVAKNAVCIKGILSSPVTGDRASINYQLRSKLDLFANVVNVRTLPGIQTRHKNIDIIIIREQTEGEFSSLEHESVKGVVECYKIVTAEKSRRIAKFAFDYATKHNRRKVTAVHKANIMKLGDGLFLKCCTEVAKLYPKIQFDSMIIDNCTMQLVSNPHQFDVLVMGNLYGSIVDNIGAGLVGGAGVVVGSSYSANSVVYEPGARHTFSEAVGKNVANPTAIILCAAKMLMHVNLQYHGSKIYKAVEKVMKSGKTLTKDMGGQASTQEYTYAIINALQH